MLQSFYHLVNINIFRDFVVSAKAFLFAALMKTKSCGMACMWTHLGYSLPFTVIGGRPTTVFNGSNLCLLSE